MVESLVRSAEENQSDIVVCDMRHYDNVTGIFVNTAGFLRTSYLREFEEKGYVCCEDIPEYIMMFAFSGPPNKLYRKEFLDRTGLLFQNTRRDNDEYFVLGDNRNNSSDSRIIGAINKSDIVGVTNFRLFPFSGFGKLD